MNKVLAKYAGAYRINDVIVINEMIDQYVDNIDSEFPEVSDAALVILNHYMIYSHLKEVLDGLVKKGST